ncbi:tetratricopeptide repeat protein [Micromonospora sp. NPDC003197]
MRFLPSRPKPLSTDLDRRARAALALFHAGQYAAAERAWNALLADCERQLGPDHPETLCTLDRLGSALFRLRRPVESADLHREAHLRAVASLGRSHPTTLMYAYNLGCALVLIRAWGEGLPVLRETLWRQRRKLGKAHPASLATAKTLGVSLFMAGNAQASLELLESSYQMAAQVFGPQDPLVRDIGENLRVVRSNTHRF